MPELNHIVERTIPEFVRDDHPTFTAFISAWLKFIDSSDGGAHKLVSDLSKSVDVDETDENLEKLFRKSYMVSHPAITIGGIEPTETSFLVKNLREIYRRKGSEAAFKFLFRSQFNEDVEIVYPRDYILKASDGKWFVPQYIEFNAGRLNDVNDIKRFFNKHILGLESGAYAYVDVEEDNDAIDIIKSGKLPVSDVKGTFKKGEGIEVVTSAFKTGSIDWDQTRTYGRYMNISGKSIVSADAELVIEAVADISSTDGDAWKLGYFYENGSFERWAMDNINGPGWFADPVIENFSYGHVSSTGAEVTAHEASTGEPVFIDPISLDSNISYNINYSLVIFDGTFTADIVINTTTLDIPYRPDATVHQEKYGEGDVEAGVGVDVDVNGHLIITNSGDVTLLGPQVDAILPLVTGAGAVDIEVTAAIITNNLLFRLSKKSDAYASVTASVLAQDSNNQTTILSDATINIDNLLFRISKESDASASFVSNINGL